jgi:hypothetical protein
MGRIKESIVSILFIQKIVDIIIGKIMEKELKAKIIRIIKLVNNQRLRIDQAVNKIVKLIDK